MSVCCDSMRKGSFKNLRRPYPEVLSITARLINYKKPRKAKALSV